MLKRKLVLLIIASGLLFQCCNSQVKHTAAGPIAEDPDSALIRTVNAKETAAILASPLTKEMVNELGVFFEHKLGRYFNGSMLVARKGVVIFEKYQGFGNFSNKTPIDRHTSFQLASTSKPFTGMGILWLQQQGKLSINDSIQQFFPKFPYRGITLKMLLSHRSGLPNYLYFCDSLWPDRSKLLTNQEVIDLMIQHHPKAAYPPNTHFQYCNTNYCLLAAVVEKVTGEKLGDFLKNTFFGPLGMKDTWVYNPNHANRKPSQSLSYDYRNREIANECYDGVVGDKNVYSTVEDLLKWDQALYSGKLFTKATLDEAFTPYSHERPGIKNYGLGWRLLVYPDGRKIVYHNGWWHGNNSVFYRFIQDSTTLIILSNRYNRGVYQVKPVWSILHEADGAEDTGEE